MFVPRALPGEQLLARITTAPAEKKRSFARAEKVRTERVHDNAIDALCPNFGLCGGCTYQTLRYAAQCAVKERQVADLLRRIARIPDPTAVMQPMVACDHTYGYRNKMEFSFAPASKSVSESFVMGLHRPGQRHDILPISECSIQSDLANSIMVEAEMLCRLYKLQVHDPAAGRHPPQSGLQHLVIRHSVTQDQYLVNFVTAGKAIGSLLAPVAEALGHRFGGKIAGVTHSVSQRGRPVEERRVSQTTVLWGRGKLVEKVHGLEFEISPNAFFQTNTRQAEKLFALVEVAAGSRPSDTVLDLYCGTGVITLLLARRCRKAFGVEMFMPAIEDARSNAVRNNIENIEFTCADAGVQLPPEALQADIVVVDPARTGLSPQVVESLRGTAARRCVYVSCDPATQARDIALLCAPAMPDSKPMGRPFRLISVTPVDMTPQTPHIETVAVLDRV